MAAINAVITASNKGKTEFNYNIDKDVSQEYFKQLYEGLLKVQKDLNDKLTEYVNEEKAVNASSSNSATKSQVSDNDGMKQALKILL